MEFIDCTDMEKSLCGKIFRKTNGVLLFVCIHCTTFEFDSLCEYTIHINETHFSATTVLVPCEVKIEKLEDESDGKTDCPFFENNRSQSPFDLIDHQLKAEEESPNVKPLNAETTSTGTTESKKIDVIPVKRELDKENPIKVKKKIAKKKAKTRAQKSELTSVAEYDETAIIHNDNEDKSLKSGSKQKYICDYCNVSIKYKSDIVKHMKTEHFYTSARCQVAQSAVCNFCGKLVKPSRLAVHIRSHTNNRPFKCSYCDTRCFTNSHLKVHIIRWHTGDRKHQCETCGKKFVAPHQLRTHIRTHTG